MDSFEYFSRLSKDVRTPIDLYKTIEGLGPLPRYEQRGALGGDIRGKDDIRDAKPALEQAQAVYEHARRIAVRMQARFPELAQIEIPRPEADPFLGLQTVQEWCTRADRAIEKPNEQEPLDIPGLVKSLEALQSAQKAGDEAHLSEAYHDLGAYAGSPEVLWGLLEDCKDKFGASPNMKNAVDVVKGARKSWGGSGFYPTLWNMLADNNVIAELERWQEQASETTKHETEADAIRDFEHVIRLIGELNKEKERYAQSREATLHIDAPWVQVNDALERDWRENVQPLIDDIQTILKRRRALIRGYWPNTHRLKWNTFYNAVAEGKDNYEKWKASGWPDIHIQELQAVNRAFVSIKRKSDQPGQADEGRATHSPDYRSVSWYGQDYVFTPNQAAAVKILWEAAEQNAPDVSQAHILTEIESDAQRLRDVFDKGKHAACGTMIVKGKTRGTFRLAFRKEN